MEWRKGEGKRGRFGDRPPFLLEVEGEEEGMAVGGLVAGLVV